MVVLQYNATIPIMHGGISEKFWGLALMFVFMDGAGSDLPPNLSLRSPINFSEIPPCMIGMVALYMLLLLKCNFCFDVNNT